MRPQLLLPDKRLWRSELPADAEVLVSPSDQVEPDTPVARCHIPAPPVVLELGQSHPLVLEGQEVQAGEVVARRKRLIGARDEVRSPIAGRVLGVKDGYVLLQPPPLASTLVAQLPGTVAAARSGWGIEIEGCFGFLRGWSGWGPSQNGCLGEDVAIVVEPLTLTSLQALSAQEVRAVIAPSWADRGPTEPLVDGPTVVFSEPFQGCAMATPIAEALQRHKGQPVALRLESPVIVAFAGHANGGPQCFGPGAWVRAADGRAGKIVSMGESPRFFASGLGGVPAEVDFGDRTETLPFDGLDWIA